MPDFGPLDSLMMNLHEEFVRIYYLMLPVFFALSIALTWIRHPQGSVDFIDALKRAIVSTLLLAAFPEISQVILTVADGISERIDQVRGLDNFLALAKERTASLPSTKSVVLLAIPDLLIALIAFVSYLLLYIARYLTIAMYHFYWTFYMVTAPLLLLFNLFPSTSQIAGNLFKGLIEVASWKIVWALLGAMMTAISFGETYKNVDNYITLVVMNFVVAFSMLKTPAIVKSLISGGIQGTAGEVGGAAGTMIAVTIPAKGAVALKKGRAAGSFAKEKYQNYRANKNRVRDQ
jgi:hypothetical protein